jgi:hypothetical protein
VLFEIESSLLLLLLLLLLLIVVVNATLDYSITSRTRVTSPRFEDRLEADRVTDQELHMQRLSNAEHVDCPLSDLVKLKDKPFACLWLPPDHPASLFEWACEDCCVRVSTHRTPPRHSKLSDSGYF